MLIRSGELLLDANIELIVTNTNYLLPIQATMLALELP